MIASIEEGFKHLTDQREWHLLCKGLNPSLKPSTARSTKLNFKNGGVSTDRMIELLESAGYIVIKATCILPDAPNGLPENEQDIITT